MEKYTLLIKINKKSSLQVCKKKKTKKTYSCILNRKPMKNPEIFSRGYLFVVSAF